MLIIEYFHQKGWKPKVDLNILWPFLALVGFLIYLNINTQITGNPFTFVQIQSNHFNNNLDPWAGLTSAYDFATGAPYPHNITAGITPLASRRLWATDGGHRSLAATASGLHSIYVSFFGACNFNIPVEKRSTLCSGNVSHVHPAWLTNPQKSSHYPSCARVGCIVVLFHGALCLGLVGFLKFTLISFKKLYFLLGLQEKPMTPSQT